MGLGSSLASTACGVGTVKRSSRNISSINLIRQIICKLVDALGRQSTLGLIKSLHKLWRLGDGWCCGSSDGSSDDTSHYVLMDGSFDMVMPF